MKEAIYFRQKLFPGECFLMCVAGKGSRLEFFVGTITHMAEQKFFESRKTNCLLKLAINLVKMGLVAKNILKEVS